MRLTRIGLISVLAVCAVFALAGNASAATGQISYQGCLASEATQGCADLPQKPLDRAAGVAESPDGRSVYVTSYQGHSIVHFSRDPATGGLTYVGCANNDGSQGCTDVPGTPLTGARGVTVSPDGKFVYVASGESDSVTQFARNADNGYIAWQSCLASTAADGCTDVPGEPLNGASGVAVSHDGSLYVASPGRTSVSHLFRTGQNGDIAWGGCLANDATQGCVDVPGTPLREVTGVAVSPDGKSVYAASSIGDSIAHLARNVFNGNISWDSCLASTGVDGCTEVPDSPLDGASAAAVSPDGKSVYVTSHHSNSISHLSRNGADGRLAWAGCLADNASDGCVDLPGTPLDGARSLAVSGDGGSVYVTAGASDSVGHLFRDAASGGLSWDACLGGTAGQGCTIVSSSLESPRAVTVSGDGGSVYVVADEYSAVAHFSRELPPPPPAPGTPPSTGDEPAPSVTDALAPRITGLGLTRRRFRAGRGTTFRYRLSERASVRVVIERPLPGRWVAAGKQLTRSGAAGPNRLRFSGRIGRRKLRPGVYRARFTATDPSGNRSRTASVRFRIV